MLMDVLVTGLGVVAPLGIGHEPFWQALCAGRSGVGPITLFDARSLPVAIAAEVPHFEPKAYVTNRKSLKVMCRDSQLGVAAAGLACRDAALAPRSVDPQRLGVVLGADRICSDLGDSETTYNACMVDRRFDYNRWGNEGMARTFPLNFLRVLPNMIASHVSIAHDARGPNNTIHQGEVSGALALGEAADVIRRGWADVMLAGGASSQLCPFDCVRHCAMGILSPRQDPPEAALRPFDAGRDGQVWGEGAAVFVLESRAHAEARGANVYARLAACACTHDIRNGHNRPGGRALQNAIGLALQRAGLAKDELGYVCAHSASTVVDDALEAQAIHNALPDTPVTALKSYFGNLGAAGAAVEMAANVLALRAGHVPATLNYRQPDRDCPVPVICGEPLATSKRAAMLVSRTPMGQNAVLAAVRAD
jgi:3-oxoacyl-[acyl-carrier-protein] synthase II